MNNYSKAIDFYKFKEWAERFFKDIKVGIDKIRLNSIYCDHLGGDNKHHLWCRPYTGYYHCYKSGKKGSLYDLVMDVEKCSYTEAVDILDGSHNIRYLESKLEEFFSSEYKEVIEEEKSKLSLPSGSISISKLVQPYRNIAINYLKTRKLPYDGLYYCISGDFGGRIIIPYYDSDGELVYFNSRDIVNPKPFLRYKGPDKSLGFRKEEVVWMSFFPRKGAKIYLTEGEFDAMTLNLCGLHGCAFGGKEVNNKQISMIMDYEICMAFDCDVSGKDAFQKIAYEMFKNGVKKVNFVRPPKPYKDWNEMLAGSKDKKPIDPAVIKAYILQKEKPFNEYTSYFLS